MRCNSARSELDSSYTHVGNRPKYRRDNVYAVRRKQRARPELAAAAYAHVGHNRPNDGVACLFRLRPSRARQKLDTAGRNDADTAGRNDTDTAGRNDADTAGRNDADTAGRNDADTAGRNDADTAGRNNADTADRNDADTADFYADTADFYADTAGRNNADYPGGMTQKNSGTF